MEKSNTYMSKVPSVRAVTVHALPNNSCRLVHKIATIDDVMVAATKTGKLYSNTVRNNGTYIIEMAQQHKTVLMCLVRLGVLPKEDVDKHLKIAMELTNKRERVWALKRMKEYSKQFEFKLTKKQLEILGEDHG